MKKFRRRRESNPHLLALYLPNSIRRKMFLTYEGINGHSLPYEKRRQNKVGQQVLGIILMKNIKKTGKYICLRCKAKAEIIM